MKNQLKFSATNVTTDTYRTRLHDCPSCQCIDAASRPQSPLYRPASPHIRNNIYFQRSNVGSISPNSSRSYSTERRSITPSRPTRVTIRYQSPPPSHNIPSQAIISQNFNNSSQLSSLYTFRQVQEPKKPNILYRNSNKKTKAEESNRLQIISQYRSLQESEAIAKTLIQQLQLNYDYFGAQDISDISADVSL